MGNRISPSWRWLGLLLLLSALIIGLIIATDTKIFQRVEAWAISDKDEEVDGSRPVPVPPWNASEENPPRGWVGFNVTLQHRDREGYDVEGMILPYDGDRQPALAVRVVNETGLERLVEFGFDNFSLTTTKFYASTFLEGSVGRLHADFKLRDVDTNKYVFLFRGLKNETQDRLIAVFLKETWLEEKTLLEPTTTNIFLVATTAVIGSVLVVRKPKTNRKSKARLEKR